jgi:hypothetical protein
MNKIYFSILISIFTFLAGANMAQQTPKEKVMKDYPTLYTDFQIEVDKQKSRYVFAVDISDSMKDYEGSVKSNLKSFIKELPDGDYITLIQMEATEDTKTILGNQPLNESTRNLIYSYIDGLKFNQKGSDGYTMTKKIIESLNQTGASEDMKYVFMFTDFEYWTKENGYNKNKVKWNSLGAILKDKSDRLKVFGLELFQGKNNGAIYKTELKNIYGKLEEISVSNTTFLNTWFSNMKADILCDRLQYVLKRNISQENAKLILSASGLGKDLSINLKSDKMSSVYTTAVLDAASLAEVKKVSESRPWIGSYEPQPIILTVKARLRSPKYLNDKKSTPSNPYNEVDKLLEPQFAEYKIEVYEGKPYLQWYIGWPLVAIFGFWMLSIIYNLLTYKADKRWNLSATLKNAPLSNVDGNELKSFDSKSFTSVPFECGQGAKDYSIEECGFKFSISSKRNILCIPFLKRGYYITKISGGEMAFVKNRKEQRVSTGESLWIGSPKASPVGAVQVNRNEQFFIINIR